MFSPLPPCADPSLVPTSPLVDARKRRVSEKCSRLLVLCWHGARQTHNQSLGEKQIIFLMNTLTVFLGLALQIKEVSDISRSKLCFFLRCRQRVLNDTDLIRQSRKLRCSSKCLFVFYELHWLTVPISKGVWPAFLLLFFPLFSPPTQTLSR